MKPRNLLAILATMFAVLTLGSTAHAATSLPTYYWGDPNNDLLWPTCGSTCYSVSPEPAGGTWYVSESSARTVNGNTVCAATLDTSVTCSSTLAVKSLCGCQARRPHSRGTVNGPRPRGRAQFIFQY